MADGGGTSCNDAAAVADAAALLDTTSIGIVITISAGNIMCLSELPYNKFWSCFLCHIYTLDYAVTGCSGEIRSSEGECHFCPYGSPERDGIFLGCHLWARGIYSDT